MRTSMPTEPSTASTKTASAIRLVRDPSSSLVAALRFKIGMIPTLFVSAAIGGAYFLFVA